MLNQTDRTIAAYITRLIRKENLTRQETSEAFHGILKNETTEMQQGAFLAALTAKGETAEEIAGCWEAVSEADTNKVTLDGEYPVVENCGTGMDTFKTFNISTVSSILAAAGGIRMARHGARAITSVCGTVDIAEALGVDVECSAELVAHSIKTAHIGLFNGMSPQIHPNALGRILSQIGFGSTLNIAASLANPAFPKRAVRGVYHKKMITPVIKVMRAIGFERALVMHGEIDHSDKGMDEASVCGTTYCAELKEKGEIRTFSFRPQDLGLPLHDATQLQPDRDLKKEAKKVVALLTGRENGVRRDIALLNAGLVYYIAGKSENIEQGIKKAADALTSQAAVNTLKNWIKAQNRTPEKGLETLNHLL